MTRTTRAVEETRPVRVPVAADRAPLAVKGLDYSKYKYRWVMDKDDRIPTFLEGGYEFVNKNDASLAEPAINDGSGIDNRRSKAAGGESDKRLYLMRIPKEFWEEDQKLKQKEVDATEATMVHPSGKVKSAGVDYGSITMNRGNFDSANKE